MATPFTDTTAVSLPIAQAGKAESKAVITRNAAVSLIALLKVLRISSSNIYSLFNIKYHNEGKV
jgi:hypothetical protein